MQRERNRHWHQLQHRGLKDLCKDGWYNRISPTSFYPMQSGIATDAQAASMVEKWLTPKDKFCIAVDGDSKGNDDSCHWGLPSISADDAAFPPLGYWRGYVWGPMAQLTYWSLQQYPHVPVVAKGRAALAKQMTAMGMDQWHKHHHVCENYSPWKQPFPVRVAAAEIHGAFVAVAACCVSLTLLNMVVEMYRRSVLPLVSPRPKTIAPFVRYMPVAPNVAGVCLCGSEGVG